MTNKTNEEVLYLDDAKEYTEKQWLWDEKAKQRVRFVRYKDDETIIGTIAEGYSKDGKVKTKEVEYKLHEVREFKTKRLKHPHVMVKDFHDLFGYENNDEPTILTPLQASTRIGSFVTEEIVELMEATADGDEGVFLNLVDEMMTSIKQSLTKTLEKGLTKSTDPVGKLVGQADALIDIKYFIEGTFDLMGINPIALFDIVHRANMNKIGEDGKPIVRESDGKFMKPDNWEEDFAPEPRLRREIERQIAVAQRNKK